MQHLLSFSDILWLRCVSQREPVLLKGIFFCETLMEPRSCDFCGALQTWTCIRFLSHLKDMLICRDYRWCSEVAQSLLKFQQDIAAFGNIALDRTVPMYCDPLSYIIASEGHFEIKLPLNMHSVYHTKPHRITVCTKPLRCLEVRC